MAVEVWRATVPEDRTIEFKKGEYTIILDSPSKAEERAGYPTFGLTLTKLGVGDVESDFIADGETMMKKLIDWMKTY